MVKTDVGQGSFELLGENAVYFMKRINNPSECTAMSKQCMKIVVEELQREAL